MYNIIYYMHNIIYNIIYIRGCQQGEARLIISRNNLGCHREGGATTTGI